MMNTSKSGAYSKLPLCMFFSIIVCSGGTVHAADALSPDSPWMLGDWGGLRSELQEKGYTFTLGYTGEVADNLGGGYSSHKTGRYSDQFVLGTTLDLEEILSLHDAEFQLTITDRNGQNLSQAGIGDPRTGTLSSVQEVSGRGQTWRLTQAWYRQGFFNGQLDVKVGRLTVGEDFGTFSCRFQNLTFCGSQSGDWAGDIIYNWPVSQWGVRVKTRILPDTYLQVAAYEQNPSYLEIGNGFKLSGSGSRGFLLPVELIQKVQLGEQNLPGEYRIGVYRSTASADDVYRTSDGLPQPLSTVGPKEHGSKYGGWLVAQQQVYQDADFNGRGLTLFALATFHDKATSFIDHYYSVGAFYSAPFDSRPSDEIGIAASTVHVNSRVHKRQKLSNQVAGNFEYNDPNYIPPQRLEHNFEVYYGFALTKWLTVRPNIQLVRSPGGVNEVSDAWVAGLKLDMTL
ncbi:carbohydrate porin [Pseudomonas monteilii]